MRHEERFRGKWISKFDKIEIGKVGISEKDEQQCSQLIFYPNDKIKINLIIMIEAVTFMNSNR